MKAGTLTTKDLSRILGRHPRTVRKLLRRFRITPEWPAVTHHRFSTQNLQTLKARMRRSYERELQKSQTRIRNRKPLA